MSVDNFTLTERLERLVESGLRPQDVLEYVTHLKELSEEVERSREAIRLMSRVFKALSHPTRLKILRLLSLRDMCVCEIMAVLDATQPTTSHHLNILENMRLIEERREGKWVFYSIAKTEKMKRIQQLIQLM